MNFADLIVGVMHLVEAAFGPGEGAVKQAKVVQVIHDGLTQAKVAGWIVSISDMLLPIVIPMLVAKFNKDPQNSTFTKS